MTLAQLQSFVLVARLGSVKAAAAELEVTEPAVSVAVAALRKELGDELFVRDGRGIASTNIVAEHIGPLIDAFGARDPRLELAIEEVRGSSIADLLEHRRADIAF